jgi:hypothetical protein
MLVGRCSSQLSGHQNDERNQKVTTSERSRGICSSLHLQLISDGSITLSFVIASEAEGSAVPRTLLGMFFDRVVMGPPKVMKTGTSVA